MDTAELVAKISIILSNDKRNEFKDYIDNILVKKDFSLKRRLMEVELGERFFMDVWYYREDSVTVYISDLLKRNNVDILVYCGVDRKGWSQAKEVSEELSYLLRSGMF